MSSGLASLSTAVDSCKKDPLNRVFIELFQQDKDKGKGGCSMNGE